MIASSSCKVSSDRGKVKARQRWICLTVVLVLVLGVISTAFAQPPSPAWTIQSGIAGNDSFRDVAFGPAGLYAAKTVAVSESMSQGFVEHYDLTGALVWSTQMVSEGTVKVHGIAAGDGMIVAGGAAGSSVNGAPYHGATDGFIVRLASDGSVLWTAQFATGTGENVLGVDIYDGAIYVTGITYADFPGVHLGGERDGLLLKYNADGNYQWGRQFGTAGDDWGYSIAVDETGIYIAGSTLDLPNTGHDGFLIAYDLDGNLKWNQPVATDFNDLVQAVTVNAGKIYVAGATAGIVGETNKGFSDAWVRSYDPDGTINWTTQFGTPSGDRADGVAVGLDKVYVAGITFGSLSRPQIGGGDVFLATFDQLDGQLQDAVQIGSDMLDFVEGVAMQGNRVVVSGYTQGTLAGTVSGDQDGFLSLFTEDSIQVQIDIKPEGDDNCINNNGHGVIPVAVLGGETFDVAMVDEFSLQLDGADVRVKGKSGNAGSYSDVNGDGFVDLVVQIEDTDGVYDLGDSVGTLTGYLKPDYGGHLIQGSDSICIVP